MDASGLLEEEFQSIFTCIAIVLRAGGAGGGRAGRRWEGTSEEVEAEGRQVEGDVGVPTLSHRKASVC